MCSFEVCEGVTAALAVTRGGALSVRVTGGGNCGWFCGLGARNRKVAAKVCGPGGVAEFREASHEPVVSLSLFIASVDVVGISPDNDALVVPLRDTRVALARLTVTERGDIAAAAVERRAYPNSDADIDRVFETNLARRRDWRPVAASAPGTPRIMAWAAVTGEALELPQSIVDALRTIKINMKQNKTHVNTRTPLHKPPLHKRSNRIIHS